MKKLLAFILLLTILLSGCTFEKSSPKRAVNYVKPEIEKIDSSLLPDFPYKTNGDDYVSYENVSVEDFEAYIDSMCNNGFVSSRDEYSVLLYNDHVFMDIWNSTFNNGYFNMHAITEKINENSSALTNEEAMRVIDDDRVFLVSEQTTDDFYEATGAQYFYAPIHNFDIYDDSRRIPENAGYHIAKFIVNENNFVSVDNAIRPPVVCDINNDGIRDIVVLGYGPTSGIFTITLSLFNIIDGEILCKSNELFTLEYGDVDIIVNDDNPILIYKRDNFTINDDGEQSDAVDSDAYYEYEIEYINGRIVLDYEEFFEFNN